MASAGLAPLYRWHLEGDEPGPRERLCRLLELQPLTAQVLLNRGSGDPEQARAILRPSLSGLPEPERLPEFEAAAAAFERAFASGRPILIHGDYDVDGIAGSALLRRLLRLLGHPVEVFLPDRVQDGYSFSDRSLEAVRACGAGLVVSVDNGTTAVDAIRRLGERGVEVVVADHHPPGPERPPCAALLNPWLGAADGCFPHLCGTAVAYLLAWGLLRRRAPATLPEDWRRFLIDALGLVAVATIADVMPLIGPNRALVTEGLRALGGRSFPGLSELLRVAGVRGTPSAEDVAFRLAPRLNAAGRMGRPELALELLGCADPARARALATELDALNVERREVEQREMRALEDEVEAQVRRGERVIFAGRAEGAFGVLGVVANRILDATGLPALVWAECGPGLARGSARAPAGVDLVQLLDGAAAQLDGYGGHARAAGFRFAPARALQLGAALREAARALPAAATPTLAIDAEVRPGELSPAAVEELQRLAPFGEGHREPVFLAPGMTVAALRPLGDGSHLELRLERGGGVTRALGWRMAERLAGLGAGARVDVAFAPALNVFRGRREVEWILRDLRSSD